MEGQQGSVGREWMWRGTRAVLGGSGCCVLVRVHVEELRHRHSWWPGNRERGSRQEIQTEADTDRGRYRQRQIQTENKEIQTERYRQKEIQTESSRRRHRVQIGRRVWRQRHWSEVASR